MMRPDEQLAESCQPKPPRMCLNCGHSNDFHVNITGQSMPCDYEFPVNRLSTPTSLDILWAARPCGCDKFEEEEANAAN